MFLSRENEWDRLKMRINQQHECVVTDWFTFKTNDIDRIATQQHSNTANKRRRPFFLAHLGAAGIKPHHISNLRSAYPATAEKFWAAKYRVRLAKPNQPSRELQKLVLLFVACPIEPADLVVLAISIVIALLRSSPLVSAGKHRHASGKKKRRQKVPALAFAQGVDLRVVGWTFHAAIPREIVIVAVVVAVAVQLVVLFVVADQVAQRETIVRSDEINARVRAPPSVLVQIGAAGEPVTHLADAALVALPKTANCVGVLAVPFRKRHRKIANLISAVPDVPRFRN